MQRSVSRIEYKLLVGIKCGNEADQGASNAKTQSTRNDTRLRL